MNVPFFAKLRLEPLHVQHANSFGERLIQFDVGTAVKLLRRLIKKPQNPS